MQSRFASFCIALTTRAALTIGLLSGAQIGYADGPPTRFSLLPPAQVAKGDNSESGTDELSEKGATKSANDAAQRPMADIASPSSVAELPPAFQPPKRVALLPPAFVADASVTAAVGGAPDASQVQSATRVDSPFDQPKLELGGDSAIIAPTLPPSLNGNFASPSLVDGGSTWDPGSPPMPNVISQITAGEPDATGSNSLDDPFYQQILQQPTVADETSLTGDPTIAAPAPEESDRFWWRQFTARPMRSSTATRPVSIHALIGAALQHSAQVQVISDSPLIRETAIVESDAAFDWSGFMETTWYDTNEPVGSTLTTGGPERFENKLFEYEYGLRKQTSHGGRVEVGQRYGHENSNSIFFIPNDQGTARLTLNYTQPLLRGAGRVYNTSLVLLAQVEAGAARNEFSRELQEHLLEVTRSYWALYLERGALIQKQRLLKRGEEILGELEHREMIDAVANQVVRARAAVAARESDLFRSAAAVKNAEGRIRALVNSPELGRLDEFELIPIEQPTECQIPVDMTQSLQCSFRHRPEVQSAIKQIKASSVRQRMSKNELLPALDVVLETYTAGLRGESDIGGSWNDMFKKGEPSYSAGIQLDIPLRNREAKARFQRRAIELRQFQNQLRATLHAMQLEVEIAVREVQTSHREMTAKRQAMEAAASEVDYIDRRWRLLPGDDRTASLVLEDLLGAQERLTAEEFDYLNAQVTYNLALTSLNKATGTLLHVENVSTSRDSQCGIPQTRLHQSAPARAVPAGYDAPMR